ncbi:hypothetical protein LY76DRAFT_596227 [Colletotrichum caudatum]|nr:hypothetical protein LY76DRAFT_596227 [Colletotrichum caudatum]
MPLRRILRIGSEAQQTLHPDDAMQCKVKIRNGFGSFIAGLGLDRRPVTLRSFDRTTRETKLRPPGSRQHGFVDVQRGEWVDSTRPFPSRNVTTKSARGRGQTNKPLPCLIVGFRPDPERKRQRQATAVLRSAESIESFHRLQPNPTRPVFQCVFGPWRRK